MEIRILNTEVSSLNLRKVSLTQGEVLPIENQPVPDFKFETIVIHEKDELDVFGLVFQVKLNSLHEFNLDLSYICWFKTSESITEEFMESPFISINVPAIAFPYLRSFISNFLLNAGYKPFFMPSINFVKLYEQKIKNTNPKSTK